MIRLIFAIIVAEMIEHAVEAVFAWLRGQYKKKFGGQIYVAPQESFFRD
jgi:hypothetical protein